jgi:hypothetical protein
MSPGSDGLRRYPRFPVDVQATVHTKSGRTLPARTRDLSRAGICLITAEPLSSGETLHVELVLLIGASSESEPLPLRARVVWCTAIASAFQIGAMFDGLSSRESSFLDMFLRYLDGSILPAGAEMEGTDDVYGQDQNSPTESPSDKKDDPFRR